MRDADRRTRLVAIGGITALALVVRLAGLGDRLSDAEGYTWLVASAPDAGALLDRLAAYENTPPLFYALTALLPNGDEAWLRVFAVTPAVATVPVVYALVRGSIGTRAGLLAALLVAIAPYHVSYSNYARGFMLAGFGLALALWAAVRLAEGRGPRWWWLYAAGGVLAVWSEYDAALFLIGLCAALLTESIEGSDPFKRVGLALLPLLTLVPWIGEIDRAMDAVDVTKINPTYPDPGAVSFRDLVTALALGEHGAGSGAARWFALLAILAVLGAAVWVARERTIVRVVTIAGATDLVLHALAVVAGVEIFNQRYLTPLIPLAAILLAAGVDALDQVWLTRATVAACLVAAVAVFAQRVDRELEPAPPEVRAEGRTVFTNSGVLAFDLRDDRVVVDRPFGLGEGRRCGSGCLVVEDRRAPGGLRDGLVISDSNGPFVVAETSP
jgi:4-amino-4-deoxy-L-arabinose transferase-like glycosyltransferase